MKLLIVDDDPVAVEVLRCILQDMGHEVVAASDGREAMVCLRSQNLSVVISDWEMPDIDGLALCRWIRSEDLGRYVYLILLTARRGHEHLVHGLEAGADEFMSKPVAHEELAVRLRTAERILSLETRDLTIFALASLAESRDWETGGHLQRVRLYSRCLAESLRSQAKFRTIVTPAFVNLIFQTSPLHDIGKVSIPDYILLKPGRLDDREFEIMKTHAQVGADTLDKALRKHPGAEFLHMARDIAQSHHERYDGKGYPARLAGEAIPLSARVFAVADVYDALISQRVYKAAFSHDLARGIIAQEPGTQFDPDVVEAFLRCEQEFRKIGKQLADGPMVEATAAL
jgi:putative two-component system response regulator